VDDFIFFNTQNRNYTNTPIPNLGQVLAEKSGGQAVP
jgi:hypothetical protein